MKNLCIICQSKNRKKLFDAKDANFKKSYQFYKCLDCQTVQIDPLIKAGEIQKIYLYKNIHGDFAKNNRQFKFLRFLPFLDSLFALYLKIILKRRKNILLSRKNRGIILDIGFGDSNFLNSLDWKNWQLWGIEINRKLHQEAQKKLPWAKLQNTEIKNAKLPKNFFDVITLWHVFEHLKDPHLAVEKIASWLKKGGYLFIEVPSSNSLYLNIFGKYWQQLIVPEHQFFYHSKSFNKLLQKNRLKIAEIRNVGLAPFSPGSSLANFIRSRGVSADLASAIGILSYPLFFILNVFLFSKRENLQIVAKRHG